MNLKNCFFNACANIRCKLSYSVRVVRGIVLIMLLLQAAFAVSVCVNQNYRDILYSCIMDNALIRISYLSDNGKISDKDIDVYGKLMRIDKTGSPSCWFNPDITKRMADKKHRFIRMERVSLICGDNVYDGMNSGTGANKFNISVFTEGYSVVCSNYLSYYRKNDKNREVFIAGRSPEKIGEIALSRKQTESFGIMSPELILGKKISICIDGDVYISDAEVTGIINDDYINIFQNTEFDVSNIFLISEFSHFSDYSGGGEKVYFYKPVEDFNDNEYVYSLVEKYDVADKLNINKLFFTVRRNIKQISIISQNVLAFLCGSIVIGLLIGLYIIAVSYIKSNSSYYAMLWAMGMKQKSLILSFVLETTLLMSISVILSVPFYETLILALKLIVTKLAIFDFSMNINDLIFVYIVSSAITAFMVLFVSMTAWFSVVSKKTISSFFNIR